MVAFENCIIHLQPVSVFPSDFVGFVLANGRWVHKGSAIRNITTTRGNVFICRMATLSHFDAFYQNNIENNARVTMNNDFGLRVRRFANNFHEWRSNEWKSLTNRNTSEQKLLFTVTNVWFHSYAIFHVHTIPLKTIIDRRFRNSH